MLESHFGIGHPREAGSAGYCERVPRATVADAKATQGEVKSHADAIKKIAVNLGLSEPRVRGDGTVVVHSSEAGYRAVTRLSAAASELVGRYVHVITDDVPGAADARQL